LYENLLSDEPADFARLAEEIMGGAGQPEVVDERFPGFRDFSPAPPDSRH
jgi:MraZ protein